MNCGCHKVAYTATLCPIAFTRKSLSGAKQCYSNVEHVALGILQGLRRFHQYYLSREVCIITDHTPLIAILNNDVAMIFPSITLHCAAYTPVQSTHNIQAWPRPVHCRLAVKEQLYRRQRPGNQWNEYKCEFHQYNSKHTRMNLHRRQHMKFPNSRS